MTNPINELIESNAVGNDKPSRPLAERVVSLVASYNEENLPARQVSIEDAVEVARRSLDTTFSSFPFPEWRMFVAIREVTDFLSVSAKGSRFKIKDNSDLLPLGNPQCSLVASFSEKEVLEARAQWFAEDSRIAEECRPLVASVYSSDLKSVEGKYSLALLEATSPLDVPRDIILSILDK